MMGYPMMMMLVFVLVQNVSNAGRGRRFGETRARAAAVGDPLLDLSRLRPPRGLRGENDHLGLWLPLRLRGGVKRQRNEVSSVDDDGSEKSTGGRMHAGSKREKRVPLFQAPQTRASHTRSKSTSAPVPEPAENLTCTPSTDENEALDQDSDSGPSAEETEALDQDSEPGPRTDENETLDQDSDSGPSIDSSFECPVCGIRGPHEDHVHGNQSTSSTTPMNGHELDPLVTEFLASIGDLPQKVDAYNILLEACEAKGKLSNALAIYEKLKKDGFKPTFETCDILLRMCEKAKEFDLGVRIAEDALSTGLTLDVRTYDMFIQTCGGMKAWDTVVVLHDEMVKSAMEPTLETKIALIQACQHLGQCQRALNEFKRLQRSQVS